MILQDKQADRNLISSYRSHDIARRTRTGEILKTSTFYRILNRDNLWNDPYHASSRTWNAFHSRNFGADRKDYISDSRDRAGKTEDTRRAFVVRTRSVTLKRLHDRRELNRRRAISATNISIEGVRHRRQDVCSGLTATLGGGLGGLPYKSLRNIMTPLIEHLDANAISRLQDRLKIEADQAKSEAEQKAQIRKGLIEDTRNREAYIQALERLSGIKRMVSPQRARTETSDRIESLARPREPRRLSPQNCLDGLELVHISDPEAIETLHKKASTV